MSEFYEDLLRQRLRRVVGPIADRSAPQHLLAIADFLEVLAADLEQDRAHRPPAPADRVRRDVWDALTHLLLLESRGWAPVLAKLFRELATDLRQRGAPELEEDRGDR